MRAQKPGMRPDAEALTVFFDGEPVRCWRSDTIGSALAAAGHWVGRTTARGRPRSLFCGMGVCQDCLVTVDGVTGRRACVTAVRDGMRIASQPAAAATGPASPLPERTLRPELLVVGAGPAGLAAAAAAAERGVDVLVVDERSRPGGQYYKQPADSLIADERRLDRQYRAGRELAARARAAGATLMRGVEIWGASSPRELLAADASSRYVLRPRALVLAPGAYERAVPFPGWTLPGVITTGAAQTLLRAYQTTPGKRVLVSGNGPLNVQVAAELARAGCEVVAVAETAPLRSPRRAGAAARMALNDPSLALDGIGYGATLVRRRTALLPGSAVIAASGAEAVEAAVVARLDAGGAPIAGSERSFAVDAVCVGFGFLPSNELSRTLGCRHEFDPVARQLRAAVDERGRTSVEDLWIAGDGGGVGGAPLAEANGEIAGADAAEALGHRGPPPAKARRARRRNARFQRALWQLYAAPPLIDQLARADTPVCRCEDVTLAAVEEALEEEIEQAGAIKRATRAGMGGCQGRYCGPLLAELAARRGSDELSEAAMFAPAAPFKPTPIANLAAPEGPKPAEENR